MAEIKERTLKVLQALSQMAEPTRPTEIGNAMGEKPLDVGRFLAELLKGGLAEKVDEEQNLWAVTEKGTEYLGSIEKEPLSQPPVTEPPGTVSTVPSQSDLFRSIGERLGVGSKKGDIRLDAITYYVQRTADLDNLSSVWNALTEMGVANDVKKRWIKIYAQNIPGKEIPEELREKLEGGETEKIKAEAGDIPPKPKRFSVAGGEIIGDPEGDLNFKEALQLLAQQRGVPAEAANPLATMVEAMKMGPEMATATLTALIPLITKEPPKQAGEGDLLSKLDSLGLLKKPGEEGRDTQIEVLKELDSLGLLKKTGDGEGSETIRALQTEVKELTDEMRKQELDSVKNAMVALSNQVTELRKDVADKGQLEGRFALMGQVMKSIDSQFTGIRSDARPLLDTLAHGGGREPSKKTPEEKAKLAKGLKEAVVLEKRARELEDELLFGGKPQG